MLNSHTKRDSLLSTLSFVCRKKIKHSRTLNLASHTKAGSHFLDTHKKDNWTQQHVYMREKIADREQASITKSRTLISSSKGGLGTRLSTTKSSENQLDVCTSTTLGIMVKQEPA